MELNYNQAHYAEIYLKSKDKIERKGLHIQLSAFVRSRYSSIVLINGLVVTIAIINVVVVFMHR